MLHKAKSHVTYASGHRTTTRYKSDDVPICIQGLAFLVAFVVVDGLEHVEEVVLGMPWLEALGSITFDRLGRYIMLDFGRTRFKLKGEGYLKILK